MQIKEEKTIDLKSSAHIIEMLTEMSVEYILNAVIAFLREG